MSDDAAIRIAQSCARDPRVAVDELHRRLALPDPSLLVFFCSSAYDREALADELRSRFPDTELVGCTTAGEIGPAGYRDHSISAMSFASSAFTAAVGVLDDLRSFQLPEGIAFASEQLQRLRRDAPRSGSRDTFAFLLVDGLFGHEERVAHAFQQGLREVPLVGGSAGDGMRFERTYVFADGRFIPDAAVLVVATTPLAFTLLKTQHFVPTEERFVVTEADPARRIVTGINGVPAAEEYARVLGVDVDDLDPVHFAGAPFVVLIGGTTYMRSVQKVNGDRSLKFYCAVERGMVLRLGRSVDLVRNLELALATTRAQVGPPQALLTFDCILRKLEIAACGLDGTVEDLLRRDNAVGFNTYGEQFCGLHMNQTLTGIAFGRDVAPRDDG